LSSCEQRGQSGSRASRRDGVGYQDRNGDALTRAAHTAHNSEESSADAYRVPPHNLEAEQSLLGAILVNNEAWDRVAGFLAPEHFFEAVHARIFEAAATSSGSASSPRR
jgi:hypothetical protein